MFCSGFDSDSFILLTVNDILMCVCAGDNPHKLLQAVRSTTLPFPLPVPTYSQAVQAARASGNVLTERATIIRETVKFFLNHKYWWTSEDYDRIAELVVNEFPELRDPIVWPSTPCYVSSYIIMTFK